MSSDPPTNLIESIADGSLLAALEGCADAAEPELRLSDCDEHTADMRSMLAELWENEELCDLTLVVGGSRVRCHRVVLAAASRYFRSLFASGMRDAASDEVILEDVEERTFLKAMVFIYRGEVKVRQSEMTAFLHIASRLELAALLRRCIALFTEQLSAETAIDTFAIADALCIPELAANAKALVCKRFGAVASHASFVEMPAELLREIVGSEALCARERTVLEAVLLWVRADEPARACELESLLPLVRFPLMPVSYISDVVYLEPLVVAQPCWAQLALEAYRFQTTAWPAGAPPQAAGVGCARATARAGAREIWAVGGQSGLCGEMSQGRVEGAVSRFCAERGTWEAVAPMRTPRSKAGVAVLHGCIYCVGGSGPSGLVCATVERFSPIHGVWEAAPSLGTPRSGVGVGSLDGRIYAVGGTDGHASALADAERLSADGTCWEPIASMRTARLYAGVAVLGGHLYAIGGWEGAVDRAVASVERYDPRGNSWEPMAPMSVPRSAAGVEVVGEHIYAVGGGDGASRWHTVERYCPARNVWQRVASMSVARSNLGVASLEGSLYVVGGWDGSDDFATVERYCPRRDAWEPVAALGEGRRGLRCCVAPCVL